MVILTNCRNKEEFCELFTKRVHPINLDSLTKEYPGEEKKPFLVFGKIKKRTFWCLTQKMLKQDSSALVIDFVSMERFFLHQIGI